jgi:D-glycero-alpha-D-manno-heptose 1-phosphate guanylyltransferase
MIRCAIILAGGFGTRLQSVVKDLPKPMADISGRPFLEYLFQELSQQGIEKVVLSVGYKWETIRNYFGDRFQNISIQYAIEDQPLGTGGAILKAVLSSDEQEFFVFNGDTFFNIDLAQFHVQHVQAGSSLSIAMKRMLNFDRYGVVRTDSSNRVLSFEEKRFYEEGNINAGVYLLSRKLFDQLSVPAKFSFEKDLMEKYCAVMKFYGFPFEDYFIDIGIPEDYARAQKELPSLLATHKLKSNLLQWPVDKSWTLFLDRDGVINRKIDNDYVRDLSQFEWLPDVKETLAKLSRQFGKIIIVSNQQGVGKKLMTVKDVETIHDYIIKTIHDFGGRIDRIYFAPQLKEENSPMRKPGIGMALQARKDFPEIDFSKSIMVGDSVSDMVFGKAAGMKTVFITHGKVTPGDASTDVYAKDLSDLVLKLT